MLPAKNFYRPALDKRQCSAAPFIFELLPVIRVECLTESENCVFTGIFTGAFLGASFSALIGAFFISQSHYWARGSTLRITNNSLAPGKRLPLSITVLAHGLVAFSQLGALALQLCLFNGMAIFWDNYRGTENCFWF